MLKDTQKQQVRLLKHLQTKGSITPIDSWHILGIYRLSGVINRLREQYEIKTEVLKSSNRFGESVNFAKYIYVGVKK